MTPHIHAMSDEPPTQSQRASLNVRAMVCDICPESSAGDQPMRYGSFRPIRANHAIGGVRHFIHTIS